MPIIRENYSAADGLTQFIHYFQTFEIIQSKASLFNNRQTGDAAAVVSSMIYNFLLFTHADVESTSDTKYLDYWQYK